MSVDKNTTVGKTAMVIVWVALSGALASLVIWAGGIDWGNLAWMAPAVNTILVFAKNFADKEVANF
jgi:hypothetical protein